MATRTAQLTTEDVNTLVGAADLWGHVWWSRGWAPPVDYGDDDTTGMVRDQLEHDAEVTLRRNRTRQLLDELVSVGKVPDDVSAVVFDGLDTWAEDRYTLGKITRASMREATAALARWQLDAEERSQALRYVWVKPLVALLDADNPA